MAEKKAVFNRPTQEADLVPSAIMGGEEGIYFTFMSDASVLAQLVPPPLELAFPMVSGYIVEINKPSFSEPYREAQLGIYVKYGDTIGMYLLSLLLCGPGAEMATYLGREKSGLPKKLCEREDCIKLERTGDVIRGTVERKGVMLMDVSMKLGEYNNPGTGGIYFDPAPGKKSGGTSFYFTTFIEPDKNGVSHYSRVNMLSNVAEYTYKTWEPGRVSIRLQSSKDDPWGQLPVIENMGGAYSTNDLEMKGQFIVAQPDPKDVMPKLLTTRFDSLSLL